MDKTGAAEQEELMEGKAHRPNLNTLQELQKEDAVKTGEKVVMLALQEYLGAVELGERSYWPFKVARICGSKFSLMGGPAAQHQCMALLVKEAKKVSVVQDFVNGGNATKVEATDFRSKYALGKENGITATPKVAETGIQG